MQPRSLLAVLTSKFYTLVPHNFGRTVPPVITSADVIQQKKDMLITLADIELTQTLQKAKVRFVLEHLGGHWIHPNSAKYQGKDNARTLADIELTQILHNTKVKDPGGYWIDPNIEKDKCNGMPVLTNL